MERKDIEKEAHESLAEYIRWPRFGLDETSCLTSCLLPICMRNSSLHVGSETEYLDLNLNRDVKKCYNKCMYVSWGRLLNRRDYVKKLESEVKLCGKMVTIAKHKIDNPASYCSSSDYIPYGREL